MVLDSSAIIAILFREPGYERLVAALDAAEVVIVGAPTILETSMVLTSRLGHKALPVLAAFLRRASCETVPFTQAHLDAATLAFLRFDRGRHPAALNFGDCLSYAIASAAGLPLLFTGQDFAKTDIDPA